MEGSNGGIMYKNSFVMAVLANGNVLEENRKRIRMPFGQEYKIRLINKHSKRCGCDLIVNGEEIGRFIISDGETIDVERFIDGNNNSGKKFKFVSLNDKKVKDRDDFDNGMVEAHFFLEREQDLPKVVEHHHHHWDYYPDPWINPPQYPYNPVYCGTNGYNIQAFNCTSGGLGDVVDSGCDLKGVTVRGKKSDQKFQTISGIEFESNSTILKLMLVNGEFKTADRYCSGCGRKRRHGEKFCSNCGNGY